MPTLDNPAFGTPTIGVMSNRALLVRTLTYNRNAGREPLDERIERATYSAAGFAASQTDPRLFAAGATPNFAYATSLSGRVLRTASVDAGATVALADLDGRPLWARDARGTVTTWTYDVLGRPLTVQEQRDADPAPATRDVFRYGEAEATPQDHNLRGQCARHYDTAAQLSFASFSLAGHPLAESRQLLVDAEQEPDWAGSDEQAWQNQLDATPYSTAWDYDATGVWLTQTDAMGNQQQRDVDVAGRLAGSRLTLAGGATQTILSCIDYSASGQVLSEATGNGVVTTYAYEPETQRLAQLTITRPASPGRPSVLQDLHYAYDPVGNVLAVRDEAQPTTYWRNQKVEPQQSYTYDALYQLISASGRESANRGQQGHSLPCPLIPLPTDNTVYTNYTRTYAYDRGGNLIQIRHSAPASGNSYTTEITVSNRSNRALLARDGLTPDQVDALFDAGGDQSTLIPGQPLDWNHRGELRQVTPISRDGAADDRESYRYGSDGMRVLKISEQQNANTTQVQRALHLPGLECRTTCTGGIATENLQVIRLDAAGLATVRALHWANGKPPDIANDQLRYSYSDLIGSSLLELDGQAEICSQEAYYPYGGTAMWTARSTIEADYKTIRYSGKERDATGLYYYGFRYYQPWLGRWLSADPAGTIDGLNLYRMVRNNPLKYKDSHGAIPVPVVGKKPDDIRILPEDMREEDLAKIEVRGKSPPFRGKLIHWIKPPEKFKLDKMSQLTFEHAGPGTGFTALAHIYTGMIYFAPLRSKGLSMPHTNRIWDNAVVTNVNDQVIQSPPILHNDPSDPLPSHTQLARRIGIDQKDVVGFTVYRGTTGLYGITYTSASSQNSPLEDEGERLDYSTPEDLAKYKFVTETTEGKRSHLVSILPKQWSDPILEHLKHILGESNENPNVFASGKVETGSLPPPPPPPPPPMLRRTGR